MSITVPVHLGYEFEVKAKAAEVFAVLADVPKSASHFPKVHSLTDLGDGAYQWDMEKVGTEHINIHTVYASKYVSNKAKGRVEWTPVEGIGNALVSGSWKIKDNKKSTHVELDIHAEVHEIILEKIGKELLLGELFPFLASEDFPLCVGGLAAKQECHKHCDKKLGGFHLQ